MADKKRKLPASVWVAFGTSEGGREFALTADPARTVARCSAELLFRGTYAEFRCARYLLAPSKGKRRGR